MGKDSGCRVTSDDQPWSPKEATRLIRGIAANLETDFSWTKHALARLAEPELITSDVLSVRRNGFVRTPSEGESTLSGRCKYAIEGRAPNSWGRIIRVGVVPGALERHIKIITVMWKDKS